MSHYSVTARPTGGRSTGARSAGYGYGGLNHFTDSIGQAVNVRKKTLAFCVTPKCVNAKYARRYYVQNFGYGVHVTKGEYCASCAHALVYSANYGEPMQVAHG